MSYSSLITKTNSLHFVAGTKNYISISHRYFGGGGGGHGHRTFEPTPVTFNPPNFSHPDSDYFYDYKKSTCSINTDDTEKIYRPFSTFQLLRNAILYEAATHPYLSPKLISLSSHAEDELLKIKNRVVPSLQSKEHPNKKKQSTKLEDDITLYKDRLKKLYLSPIHYIVKSQYFPLFTGGETLEDCVKLAKLWKGYGVKLILDHSTEEASLPSLWNENVQAKIQLINQIDEKLRNEVLFIPVKMTSLTDSLLLEKMTSIMNKEQIDDPTSHLGNNDKNILNETINRVSLIVDHAKNKNMKILLDAEQYNRQLGMNYIAKQLCKKYNINGDIYIYNTYQMYLKNALKWLNNDIKFAMDNQCTLGVKLVRGAYLVHETNFAEQHHYKSPIQDSKEKTDKAYDNAVKEILHQIAQDDENKGLPNVGLLIATHNRNSINHASSIMNDLQLPMNHSRIHFAQLQGMCDNITLSLGLANYNICKLVPYGHFDHIWPYLMRRLQENQDMLGSTRNEKKNLWKEIRRRMLF